MGVLGIIGDAAEDGQFGRFEIKRVWQWKAEWLPSSALAAAVMSQNAQKSLTTQVQTFTKPDIKFSTITVNHGNERYNLAGKSGFQNDSVDITFIDAIPKLSTVGATTGDADTTLISASSILYAWLNFIQNVRTGTGTLSADYKCDVLVTQYSPNAIPIETWVYKGGYPEGVRFGDTWDYTSEDGIPEVTMTMRFDKVFRAVTGSRTAVEEPTADTAP